MGIAGFTSIVVRAAGALLFVQAAGGEVSSGSPPGPGPGDRDAVRNAPLEYGADCLRSGCHVDLAQRPVVHGPVAAGECRVCHEAAPDVREHGFRLTRPAGTLCASCHESPEPAVFVHRPFGESLCLECHDPHGSSATGLLRGESTADLCARCHERHDAKIPHGPYAVGECLLCHEAHQSDYAALVRLAETELCLQCHSELRRRLDTAAVVHGPVAVGCSSCHLPHGADRRRLLRERPGELCANCHDAVIERIASDPHPHGALETKEGCAACHTAHAADYRFLLRAMPGETCLSCHDRKLVNRKSRRTVPAMKWILAAKYRHGPVESGDCQSCHFPHSSRHEKLLHAAYPPSFYQAFEPSHYALCFSCHDEALVEEERTTSLTGFRDGDRNLHFLHVRREKGRTCRACHEVHAGDSPKQIRESVPFGSTGWLLPIGFQKTASGGSCQPGCHQAVTYDHRGASSARRGRTGAEAEIGSTEE